MTPLCGGERGKRHLEGSHTENSLPVTNPPVQQRVDEEMGVWLQVSQLFGPSGSDSHPWWGSIGAIKSGKASADVGSAPIIDLNEQSPSTPLILGAEA